MKTIYEQVNLIAHRGYSGKYVENTLSSFLNAGQNPGFFGIETDIHFTKDNKIVCSHDKTTTRLIGERNIIVDMPYNELIRKKFKPRYDYNTICPFKKYLKVCRKYKKISVIEIKCHATPAQLNKLLRIIKWYRGIKNCIVISFYSDVLVYLRSKNKKLKLQYLIKSPLKRYMDICKTYNIDASLFERIILKDTISKIKSHGIKVGVWTVNNRDQAQKFINMGANYITSNFLLK